LIFFFPRQTWSDLHTWSSAFMIVIAALHITLHRKWLVTMAQRIYRELTRQSEKMNPRARFNLWINASIGFSFLLSAASGLYFLFVGGSHGGRNPDPLFLFTRITWDAIHTWSSTIMMIAAIIHFAIHWRWIVNVTRRILSIQSRPALEARKSALRSSAQKSIDTKQLLTERKSTMIKKIVGITLLVGVIAVLAFGAINRTYAGSEKQSRPWESAGAQGQDSRSRIATEPFQPAADSGYTSGAAIGLESLPTGELSPAEEEALVFMREEEKLARDVYLFLYDQWRLPLFQNIATSEQTHSEAVAALLDRYGIADPASTVAGVFVNADLQSLYNQLTAQGSQSLADALKVGAEIEEIDILDLQSQLTITDNADIQQVFTNLLNGSYNHLRAFTSTLLNQAGETY
jgi:hypothetical protein